MARVGRKITLIRLTFGAVAGLIGTLVLQGLRTPSEKWLPRTMPPIRQDPGDYMVEKAETLLPPELQERIPEVVEKIASKLMAVGYGVTAGVIYASVRPKTYSVPLEGSVLGVAVWAAGYLGWLPALELTPKPNKQNASELIAPAVRHALFGIATVAAYRWLMERGGDQGHPKGRKSICL